ncbi:MAG: hypothetical protein WCX47_01860 [Bacilli bacterium]|nr:hypothetical protein [Bacilli bacterium]HKM10781.1 hypothetical protein [Bacilli bacterium]
MSRWEQKLKNLGFSVKKIKFSFLILIILTLIGGILLIINRQWGLASLIFASNFIIGFSFYYYVRQVQEQLIRKKEEEFAAIFTNFRIYLGHGRNVYQALQLCQEHASNNLRPLLENLIFMIDHDQSVRPFMEFSTHFVHPLIEEVVIAMYQMIDAGRDSRYLWHFNYLFSKYDEQIAEQKYQQKSKTLERINMSAMLGAGILVVALAVGIIQMIGGVMYGI